VARTHSDEDSALLQQAGADRTHMAEHELALSMTRDALERMETAQPARG